MKKQKKKKEKKVNIYKSAFNTIKNIFDIATIYSMNFKTLHYFASFKALLTDDIHACDVCFLAGF